MLLKHGGRKRQSPFRGELVKATLMQPPPCKGPCSAPASLAVGWAELLWLRGSHPLSGTGPGSSSPPRGTPAATHLSLSFQKNT